jgi:WD40 repeat protein
LVRLRALDGKDGPVRELTGFRRPVHHLTFSPDGRRLLVGEYGGGASVWDVATGRQVSAVPGAGPGWSAVSLTFAADGRPLAAFTQHNARAVRVVDVATGGDWPTDPGPWHTPLAVAVTPDGRAVLSTAEDGLIHRWDPGTGALLDRRPTAAGELWQAAFTPDGRRLVQGVTVTDAATGATVARFDTEAGAMCIAVTPDGRHVAVGSGAVVVYDADTGRPVQTLWISTLWDRIRALGRDLNPNSANLRLPWLSHRHAVTIYRLTFSGDGRVLAVATDRGLRLIDWRTRAELPVAAARDAWSGRVAFAPDGKLLAAGGQVLEAASGQPVWQPPGGRLALFSPDGRILAVALAGQGVLLWDTAARKQLGLVAPPDATVSAWPLAFTPDGGRLVTGHTDTTLLVWDVPRAAPLPAPDEPARQKAWDELHGADAAKAQAAVWVLAGGGDMTVAWLRDRLKPVPAVSPESVNRWVAELDDPRYEVRERASRQLAAAGAAARAAVERAYHAAPSPEARRRLEWLLGARGAAESSEVRAARQTQVLEAIGTAAARALLDDLARGHGEATLTRQARAAADRLDRRTAGSALRPR